MRQHRGYTLIELITALAIAAIVLSAAVPGLRAVSASSEQTALINDIVAAMHMARSAAVIRNASVSVCASRDGGSCDGAGWHSGFIVFNDADADQALDAGETVLSHGGGADTLTISNTSLGSAMTYRANGRLTEPASGGIIDMLTVCDSRGSEYAKALVIDLSSRPRIAGEDEFTLSC